MNRRNVTFTLVITLLLATTLHAQKDTAAPSPSHGDPPPASAMALSLSQARAAMREAIQKSFVGAMKYCILGCADIVFSAATNFRLSAEGVSWAKTYTVQNQNYPGDLSVSFKEKNMGYVQAYLESRHFSCPTGNCYSVGYLPKPDRRPIAASSLSMVKFVTLAWSDEGTAQRFADAFNRLVYAAFNSKDIEEEFAAFSAAAKGWRENPAKPPLNPEADRQIILAENALQEKNLDSAVEHYESAVEVQPMWPQGWFNLALLYAEQNDFADAADRMKHYLALAPDAPDSQDAHAKMIIWEDKANTISPPNPTQSSSQRR